MSILYNEYTAVFKCREESLISIICQPVAKPVHTTGVLIIVGGPQTRVGSHRQFVLLARHLAGQGFPVMRFDYRGMGDSTGEPIDFQQNSADIAAAIAKFEDAIPTISKIALWGLCDAASSSFMFANDNRIVRGVIAVNPWVRSTTSEAKVYVEQYYGKRILSMATWKRLFTGEINVLKSLASIVSLLYRRYIGNSKKQTDSTSFIDKMHHGLSCFEGRVCILLSDNDYVADEFRDLISNNPSWQLLCQRGNVTIQPVHNANHTFSSADARKTVFTITEQCLRQI